MVTLSQGVDIESCRFLSLILMGHFGHWPKDGKDGKLRGSHTKYLT
jgi:hypothetical protein